jgi:hypothetical protein
MANPRPAQTGQQRRGRRGQKEEEGGSKKKKQPEAVGWWSRNNKVSINVYGGACLLAKGLRDAAVLLGLAAAGSWLAGWLAVLAMRQGVEAGSSAWLADARRSLGGGTRRGERQKNEGKAREQAAAAALLLLACDAAGWCRGLKGVNEAGKRGRWRQNLVLAAAQSTLFGGMTR